MVKDDARLFLAHTYMPNQETDFAGPSYFGGKNDQMVFCASKGTFLLSRAPRHLMTEG